MANRKPCVNCGRNIDEFARVCPYCNWWQSQPVPARVPQAAPPPAEAVAPLPPRTRNTVIGAITFGFLIMVAFGLGALFHGSTAAVASQSKADSAPAESSSPHATVTLVPVTEGAPPPVVESPITTLPPGTTTTAGPSDATALPSQQYDAAAQRMRTAQQTTGSVVDPRSITAVPYEPPPPRRTPRPRAVTAVQTQPVPLFQPVPRVHVPSEQTAQLSLIVGTDGRVHDIDIQRAVPGVMGPLIGSVQQWRFRPAMENGEPVSSRFSVAVTFRP